MKNLEINLHSKSLENIKDKNNLNMSKSKILYKFNIMNNIPVQNKYIGKCYLVRFHSLTNKDLSSPKTINKLDKLPLIKIKEHQENKPSLKAITFTDSRKVLKGYKYKNNFTENNNESKTIPIQSYYNNKTINISNSNRRNYYKNNTLTHSFKNINTIKNRDYYNKIINKINEKYFAKSTTLKYLNDLFFGTNESHNLKFVNLSRIKKEEKIKDDSIPINVRHLSYKLKTINTNTRQYPFNKTKKFTEKSCEKPGDKYKINKNNLDEQLKNFQNLKIKKCKILVDDVLKEIRKTKEKNNIYIENFRKSCNLMFEDF
jgi:hypothetical protein